MELLQKMTLYDLLGYALPGTSLIFFLQYDSWILSNEEMSFDIFVFLVLLTTGYLVGIMISELMRILLGVFFDEEKEWENICSQNVITVTQIVEALKRAKIINDSEKISDIKETGKYSKQMYSIVQADAQYNRIHNYASAELLYKNMILVATVSSLVSITRGEWITFFICVMGMICFGIRWRRFYDKKLGYMLCWFIQKYS